MSARPLNGIASDALGGLRARRSRSVILLEFALRLGVCDAPGGAASPPCRRGLLTASQATPWAACGQDVRGASFCWNLLCVWVFATRRAERPRRHVGEAS